MITSIYKKILNLALNIEANILSLKFHLKLLIKGSLFWLIILINYL